MYLLLDMTHICSVCYTLFLRYPYILRLERILSRRWQQIASGRMEVEHKLGSSFHLWKITFFINLIERSAYIVMDLISIYKNPIKYFSLSKPFGQFDSVKYNIIQYMIYLRSVKQNKIDHLKLLIVTKSSLFYTSVYD